MAVQLTQYSVRLPGATHSQRQSITPEYGDIVWNSDNKAYEMYHELSDSSGNGENWHAVGGGNLVAHRKVYGSWSTLDLNWTPRYLSYDVYMLTNDITNNTGGIWLRVFNNGSLVDDSEYGYVNAWGCSNDGADGASNNYWYSSIWETVGDRSRTNYRTQANGESHNLAIIRISGAVPSANSQNRPVFRCLSHCRSPNGTVHSQGYGEVNLANAPDALGGNSNGEVYKIDGLRFGSHEGSIRGGTGCSTIISVFGVGGYEESESVNY